ncbi:MAG TPA: hypothetical protein VMK82_05900 [Steroidobacteraceae bacterium]|nr:hypothetical protein [Steroidobacteraceae bacterium]
MRAFALFALSLSLLVPSLAAASEPEAPTDTLKKAVLAYENCDVMAMMELTAPHQRAVLSDQALALAETTCKRDDSRASKLKALKLAEQFKPTFEEDGKYAVFDFSGMGFSKAEEKLRMIRIDEKWYLLH